MYLITNNVNKIIHKNNVIKMNNYKNHIKSKIILINTSLNK
jgi:hypothetical protein